MSTWRQRQTRRDRRDLRTDPGTTVMCWFLGTVVAAGVLAIGVYCLAADGVPIATRLGLIWITGRPKVLIGIVVTGLAFAVHVGFAWSRIPALREVQGVGLALTLLGTMAGLLLLL